MMTAEDGGQTSPTPRLMLMEGLSMDATLRLLSDRTAQLPGWALGLVTHRPVEFWMCASIVGLCFYIFHLLIEQRSEENNIWSIASKERKIEAKIMKEEQKREKKKGKLERRTRETKKQRLLRALHPSITNGMLAQCRQNGEDATTTAGASSRDAGDKPGGMAEADGVTDTVQSERRDEAESEDGDSVRERRRVKNRRRRLARKMARRGNASP